VTHLSEKADAGAMIHKYPFATPEDDRKRLWTVLASEIGLEKEQRAEDTAIRKNNADGAAIADASIKRTAEMTKSQVSGGSGLRYREMSSSGGTKRQFLFRKRQRR
jgi:hypothetical protein